MLTYDITNISDATNIRDVTNVILFLQLYLILVFLILLVFFFWISCLHMSFSLKWCTYIPTSNIHTPVCFPGTLSKMLLLLLLKFIMCCHCPVITSFCLLLLLSNPYQEFLTCVSLCPERESNRSDIKVN